MAEFPSFPIFVDRYFLDTDHLSDVEHGRYLQILFRIWVSPGQRLPNDDKWLSRKFKRTPERVREELRPLIKEFCKSDGNWITQKGLNKVRDFKRKKGKAQSDNAKSRWNKGKDVCQVDAIGIELAMPPIQSNPVPIREEDGIGSAREPLADLEVKLREAAGWQSEPAPMLAVTGPVQALIDSGADLALDVLPTVRALAGQSRSRTSWKYFLNAIAQARDDRIGAAKIVSIAATGARHGQNRKVHSRADTFSAINARLAEAELAATENGVTIDGDFAQGASRD